MSIARVAVVTGANRGIGYATVEKLAKDFPEWTVIATARTKESADEAAKKLGLANAVGYGPLSTHNEDEVSAFAGWIKEKYGRADVLINNAGIFGPGELTTPLEKNSVMTLTKKDLMHTIEVNAAGPLLMTQAVLPLMQDKGWGRIVNISSQMGRLSDPAPNAPAYRISKTTLNGLTVRTASFVDGDKIKVNSVCPGWVKTDMGTDAGMYTTDQAVPHVVWAATLPDDGPTGQFFQMSKPMAW